MFLHSFYVHGLKNKFGSFIFIPNYHCLGDAVFCFIGTTPTCGRHQLRFKGGWALWIGSLRFEQLTNWLETDRNSMSQPALFSDEMDWKKSQGWFLDDYEGKPPPKIPPEQAWLRLPICFPHTGKCHSPTVDISWIYVGGWLKRSQLIWLKCLSGVLFYWHFKDPPNIPN